jgi:putative heme-binding domain-containing protein
MAQEDASPVVRKYLAAALQRIDEAARWPVAEGLVAHAEDADDHNIPKLIWFGVEPLVAAQPARALDLAGASAISTITEFVARRLTDADELEALVAGIGERRRARLPLLRGLRDGLQGRSDVQAPANWDGVYARLQSGETASLALEVAQLFGDAEAVQVMLASLTDADTSVEERRTAVNGLASRRRTELVPYLPALLDDPDLRTEAIRAIAAFEEEDLGRTLLERFDGFTDAEQAEALQTLASRPVYGWVLTQAIADESIDRGEVPAYIARQLRRVVGNGFVEVWGPIDDLALHTEAAYAKYRALLTEAALAAADPVQGTQIFQRTCGACHTMYGEGGRVGPDLTGSNRTNLDYLLSNIVNPSEEVQDDYRLVAVTTHDGRTYLGNVATEGERQVTLRVVGQDAVVINRSDIASLEVTTASLMPEGLLDTLTDDEVLNLVAYLQTTEPVEAPSE